MAAPPWPVLAPAPAAASRGVGSQPPTWSVVVAAYQAEKTLAEAIASALEQTVEPLEVVVCDDGSSDATARVAESMGRRVRLVRQGNRGEGAAKNAAVRAARGDFVVVLDADDTFQPRRLEALAWLAARRPDLDVLVTDAHLELTGRCVGRAYHRDWPFPVDHQRETILARNFVLGLAAVRRERWLAVDGFDERFHHAADWDFFLRLILSGSQVGLVDVPLATYRLAVGTLSSDRDELIDARLEVLRRALRRDDLSAVERAVARRALQEQRALRVSRRGRAALVDGRSNARQAALWALLHPRVPLPTRAMLAAGVAAPHWTGQRWRQASPPRTELAGGMFVDADGVVQGRPEPESDDGQEVCWLRGVAVPPSLLPLRGRLLPSGVVGPRDPPVHDVAGPPRVTSMAVLEPADVVAARLAAAGGHLRWAAPVLEPELGRVLDASRRDGAASVARFRSEQALLPRLRLGSWAQAPWERRLLRRVALRLPVRRLLSPASREDVAFWAGVRSAATGAEWARFTRSYVALVYHRVAGEDRPGQERYDIAPARFDRQMRLLLRLGWRPLSPDDLARVHVGAAGLDRRRFVVTLDDGYADAVAAAVACADVRSQLYIPTAEVGTDPAWAGGAPLATWEQLQDAREAGVGVGSHGRRHVPMPDHDAATLDGELSGSLADLVGRGHAAVPLLAYPNGRYDDRVRAAAAAAGYVAAWTTLPGRNGAGTDRWSLRRISVKDWDGPISFLWKVATGEPVPAPVELLTRGVWARRRRAAAR